MREKSKLNYEAKLSAVLSITSGEESCLSVSRKIGIDTKTVRFWVARYRIYGAEVLKPANGVYTDAFKFSTIQYMYENGLSLFATAVRFNVSCPTLIADWARNFEKNGVVNTKRTQIPGFKKHEMAKDPKEIQTTDINGKVLKFASMEEELKYLRAENAFLKKLEALTQQKKDEKAKAQRSKPSGN